MEKVHNPMEGVLLGQDWKDFLAEIDRISAEANPDPGSERSESPAIELSPLEEIDPLKVERFDSLDPLELHQLGRTYYTRFERLGELSELEGAIRCASRALALTPNDDSNLPSRLVDLGELYTTRYQFMSEPDDINKSLEYLSRAVALTSDCDLDLPNRLDGLAAALRERFHRLGELGDISKSIDYISRAVALASDDDPRLPNLLSKLGAYRRERFQRTGELEDIEKSIEFISRAVDLAPEADPRKSLYLVNLGISHRIRFRRLGEIDDINKSIELMDGGIDMATDDDPNLPAWLEDLEISYHDRFQRLGKLFDIEKSIECAYNALEMTPDGSPSLQYRLIGLGVSHFGRFQHFGELEDIEQSIEYISRGIDMTPNDHPNLPSWLDCLGRSFQARFQSQGGLDDIEKSIEYLSRALAFTHDGDPDLLSRLVSLGTSHRSRSQVLGQLDDIDESIEHISRAVALTPNGHPDLPSRLRELGSSYNSRFKYLNQQDDLGKGAECASRALVLVREDDPNLPLFHNLLADINVSRYQLTPDITHLQAALELFRKATQSQVGPPRPRFNFALDWAKLSSIHTALSPIEAYQTVMDLLPQVIWLGVAAEQRYRDLGTLQDLAVRAASTAILSSNNALALEWLEHARCVVWNQNLMLKSPLDQLESSHPFVAENLQILNDQLRIASSDSLNLQSRSRDSESIQREEAIQEHHSLAKWYSKTLSRVREFPGFEDFLRPMKTDRLVSAARNGPIVIINCHTSRCDAIIILPGRDKVYSIPLPKFSHQMAQRARTEMQDSLERGGLRERAIVITRGKGQKNNFGGVLKLLWNGVVRPILEFLGYLDNIPTGHLPHITWCPTGAVSFLPLHAAGDYDLPDSRVYKYAISSYIPTLTALLSSSPTSLRPGSQVLGVGQEVSSLAGHKLSDLPGTTKELGSLKTHTQTIPNVSFSELTGEKATATAVLDAMEQHDWVHLACHANQNIEDPNKSGFLLYDGILDLVSIGQRSFKNKGLAFLSACQTATGDAKLPDEAVHLASGMLMAGYASVIATMWSVRDEDAPVIADKVYGELMKDGKVGNGEAGKALHKAVGALRDKVGEKEFGRWVPYIHVGS